MVKTAKVLFAPLKLVDAYSLLEEALTEKKSVT